MKYILGIDECSTGAWAGPVYACGVLSEGSWDHEKLNDSKKLTKDNRKIISNKLKATDLKYKIVSRDNHYIDRNGLAKTLESMYNEIIDFLYINNCEIIIDGSVKKNIINNPKFLIKGDSLVKQIMAASILGKDARDSEMLELSKKYSNYGFENNAGYGTKDHSDALEKFGICDLHRKSYKPIAKLIKG